MGVYFGGCALKVFSQKLTNIARSVFKNQSDRRQTRKVVGLYFSLFILTEHGRSTNRNANWKRARSTTGAQLLCSTEAIALARYMKLITQKSDIFSPFFEMLIKNIFGKSSSKLHHQHFEKSSSRVYQKHFRKKFIKTSSRTF